MNDEIFERIVNQELYKSKGVGIAIGTIYGDRFALVVDRYGKYRMYDIVLMTSRDLDLFTDLPLLKHFKIEEIRWY